MKHGFALNRNAVCTRFNVAGPIFEIPSTFYNGQPLFSHLGTCFHDCVLSKFKIEIPILHVVVSWLHSVSFVFKAMSFRLQDIDWCLFCVSCFSKDIKWHYETMSFVLKDINLNRYAVSFISKDIK
jgi:hypothetical protein